MSCAPSFADPGPFLDVSGGPAGFCGVRSDGSLVCWLPNPYGPFSGPIHDAPALTGLASVSVGYAHACAVGDDGAAVCWGDDVLGQSTPPDDIFTSVSAGYLHSCGARTDGRIRCWGHEGDEQSWPP